MKTIDSLGIIWTSSEGQQEVSGVYFYALLKNEKQTSFSLQEFSQIWQNKKVEIKTTNLTDESYDVFIIDLWLKEFGNSWATEIKESLNFFIEKGAIVAWCGGEDCSPNIEVLKPNNEVGNVYCAINNKRHFYFNSDLNDEMSYLNDEQLSDIWGSGFIE